MRNRLELEAAEEQLFLKSPFRIAGYTFESWPVIVATLRRAGLYGRGEASGVYYLGDTAEKILQELRALERDLPFDLDRAALRQMMRPCGARNALDCALWDLEARERGEPVWRMAGLETVKPLVTTITLSADPPEEVERAARSLSQAKALKLKLNGEVEADIERVRRVRAARPEVWMGVDANQGFTLTTLEPLISTLVACRVSLLEQPLKRGREADMAGLKLPLPVAADESCQDLNELETLVGRFDMVNIKLDKCGGLTEALMMATRARELGLGLMVGNMLGTSLSCGPAFVLGQLCDVVDLDNSFGLTSDRDFPISYADGEVWVPPEAWGDGRSARA